MLNLNSETFRDKVYGCWLGKNCGGTLGAPLEKAFGEPEPFDVWWYPQLQEGGIPNDDLEMQLIWLKALEEMGPGLRAADLAQYWLDHIGYNWDEYGLSKTNLRLGLLPPVSGHYNNWFKDCMGCPIRSEIWACIAPGMPSVAVRYAYEDAICDHAGGESVFGELFNTAIEAAAFVISDREHLLEIGLSYVPAWSKTAKAITAARNAYAAGEDWKAARVRVLQATPHYNAQYSPINMGFQVIGWLYGEDFGDAICKAVNCGYDTDCTGATLGSILGIIAGRSGLPHKWTEPLGEAIATNESWGGLRHASDGPNPIPLTLTELTDRVCIQARRVLAAHDALDDGTTVRVDMAGLASATTMDEQLHTHQSIVVAGVAPAMSTLPATSALFADDQVHALWVASPTRIDYHDGAVHVSVDYLDSPAALPGQTKSLVTHLTNPHPDSILVRCELRLPDGWASPPVLRTIEVPPRASVAVEWNLSIPMPAAIENANQLLLSVAAEGRPAQPAIPIVLVGAHRYRHSGLYPANGLADHDLFDQELEPEHVAGLILSPDARPGNWTDFYALDNALPLGDVFDAITYYQSPGQGTLPGGQVTPGRMGALYAQTYLWSLADQDAWMGVVANCPAKMWVNGHIVVQSFRYGLLRPSYGGDHESYATVRLSQGWNEVLLKFVRSQESAPFACHLLISDAGKLHDGLPALGRTRTPWDAQH